MFYKHLIFSFLLPLICSGQVFEPKHLEFGIDHYVMHSSMMGGGAVFFDADRDGDDDLYITSGQAMDHFYINDGTGIFELQSLEAGLQITEDYYTTGAVSGDFDNDGYRDIFVTTWGTDEQQFAKNLLFRNLGDNTFEEVWSQVNSFHRAFSIGATLLDFNNDGLLDIYVGNYVEIPDFIYDDDNNVIGFDPTCFRNILYKNNGNMSFTDWTEEQSLTFEGCTLAMAATDYDGDGKSDIFVANDFGAFLTPNQLFRNTGSTFVNTSSEYQADAAIYGMGIAVGDIDNDLDLDYYVTNFGRNVLHENLNSEFSDITDQSNTDNTWVHEDSTLVVSWGTAFLDIDNDKDLDLYVSNGFVPGTDFIPTTLKQDDKLFLNQGSNSFADISQQSGIINDDVSRGMAYSDIDNDGRLDILSVVLNIPLSEGNWRTRLFYNATENNNNWSQITLEGRDVHRDAFGSWVYIHTPDQVFLRELDGGSSHCSQNSSVLHFGLGEISTIDSIEVYWTGRKRRQVVQNPTVNQRIHVVEDTTLTTGTYNLQSIKNLYEIYPNPANSHISIQKFEFIYTSMSYEICGVHGMRRITGEIGPNDPIDISMLEPGMYVVILQSTKGPLARRFIKR